MRPQGVLIKPDRIELQGHRGWVVFADLITAVKFEARQLLSGVRSGPANIDSRDGSSIAQADFLSQGVRPKVPAAADPAVKLTDAGGGLDGDLDTRTNVGMVGSLNIQQTDYNNDGLLDIWALRGAWLGKAGRIPNSLLRNYGDLDNDGWLDFYCGTGDPDLTTAGTAAGTFR